MFSEFTTIVRANQNAVMYRFGGDSTNAVYAIFDLSEQRITNRGTLDSMRRTWNEKYRNSRQFVLKSHHSAN